MSSSNESPITEDESATRGQWGRKIEYFLTMLGYSVGLGNLWRFPYICLRNGGGAFLIPYFICLLLFGIPLFFLETAVGQFSGQGLLHVWEVCPIFKGVGIGMAIMNVVCSIYYNIILAWTIYYLGHSFIGPLPWTTCDNTWNSPQCVTERGVLDQGRNFTTQNNNLTFKMLNMGVYNTTTSNEYTWTNDTSKLMTAQEEFWQYNVLQMSSGIHDIGDLNWRLALSLSGAWLLICLCISKGVKSVGKVVYVTATLPYVLLTIVLVKGLTLDGSIDGVILYLKPDFSKLLKLQVWMEAAIQVFYSLGATWGPLFTMASFNKFKNNCLRDSIILSFIGEGTSIYAGLIIFTVLGFMSATFSLPLDKIVTSGPGLGFIVYPEALAQLPGPNIWSVLFFVMLLTVGLDSQYTLCETDKDEDTNVKEIDSIPAQGDPNNNKTQTVDNSQDQVLHDESKKPHNNVKKNDNVTLPDKNGNCTAMCSIPFDKFMIMCNSCKSWTHYICTELPMYQLYTLTSTSRKYTCSKCTVIPHDFKEQWELKLLPSLGKPKPENINIGDEYHQNLITNLEEKLTAAISNVHKASYDKDILHLKTELNEEKSKSEKLSHTNVNLTEKNIELREQCKLFYLSRLLKS
ncbi:Sodium- and chloride-dependent neutral and basic amino acid transporter B(0+),Sodium- and chloride-dependent taurine transporter,Sodium-dependent noradrenaline transporter,Sodium-dependent proline transporter,Sodium-and chloride-dependent glycine transporter 1,Creatine transporter,Sodium- and chloride-dependent GABA transporter 3,Sodium- and chloride-dependent betaine transporter,Sodium- and chloride-dependent GABA transporter 2,Sodium-dependent dopamine transporter,Sodium- and chloride-dependent GABA tran|uniref:Transporter n=1 Tax=Mytilus coruscus TaxID=42192 RepID=A0A6J8AXV2_MYTCO|nr:Sodium- and chloride-dependent neutral and basic amino acid transporter B(0+),Sodium- and chloride-dependent taurine transporter,Sodium-dependent noradrenaline transporter,Sodium-dependent proline transporter,Sodium-and chloride-dependent glycine transporter 1,Creatine transporter,Sodium- and chloride-dependent GABA transporter 3,Sodium- and chloride-dependent betaine transporter,Sodium- and chloride-dependent GABA transporter 2,Sodium-dependent dopamine transporter,Sodium- and chloride-dependen